MANRYSLVFGGAVAVAAAATYLVFRTVEQSKASARIATAPVVVASRDIPEGILIDRLALTVAQWPVPTIPPGTFGNIDSVAGRVSRVGIFTGEPIVPGRLAPAGTGPGIEVKLTPGKRAIGVRVNDVSNLAGMVQPNSRVDVMLTVKESKGVDTKSAKLFMENMRVLAMGAQTQRGEDGRPIVSTVASLEVTPAEAELLGVAQMQGQIQLVLRGYGDPDSVDTRGATSDDVTSMLGNGGVRPQTVAPPRQTPVRRPAATPPPVTVPQSSLNAGPPPAPAPAPKAAPARPDSFSVRIIRPGKTEERRFAKDSAKRDTTP